MSKKINLKEKTNDKLSAKLKELNIKYNEYDNLNNPSKKDHNEFKKLKGQKIFLTKYLELDEGKQQEIISKFGDKKEETFEKFMEKAEPLIPNETPTEKLSKKVDNYTEKALRTVKRKWATANITSFSFQSKVFGRVGDIVSYAYRNIKENVDVKKMADFKHQPYNAKNPEKELIKNMQLFMYDDKDSKIGNSKSSATLVNLMIKQDTILDRIKRNPGGDLEKKFLNALDLASPSLTEKERKQVFKKLSSNFDKKDKGINLVERAQILSENKNTKKNISENETLYGLDFLSNPVFEDTIFEDNFSDESLFQENIFTKKLGGGKEQEGLIAKTMHDQIISSYEKMGYELPIDPNKIDMGNPEVNIGTGGRVDLLQHLKNLVIMDRVGKMFEENEKVINQKFSSFKNGMIDMEELEDSLDTVLPQEFLKMLDKNGLPESEDAIAKKARSLIALRKEKMTEAQAILDKRFVDVKSEANSVDSRLVSGAERVQLDISENKITIEEMTEEQKEAKIKEEMNYEEFEKELKEDKKIKEADVETILQKVKVDLGNDIDERDRSFKKAVYKGTEEARAGLPFKATIQGFKRINFKEEVKKYKRNAKNDIKNKKQNSAEKTADNTQDQIQGQ